MTHSIYHVQIIGGTGASKELGTYGRESSAYGLVDRLICRLINRHKRNLTEPPQIDRVENDDGVHTFVRLTVRAHKFRKTVHAHHFLVREEVMEMSRSKPIKNLSDIGKRRIHQPNWEDYE